MRLLNRAPIVLQGRAPELSERQILRAVRIPRLQRIDEVSERGLREAIWKARLRALDMTSFAAVFRTVPVVRIANEDVLVEGATSAFRSASLAKMLEGSLFVTLLAVTLGEAWDAALDALGDQREAAEAWFLDAIGTLMADQVARLVEDRAATDMARSGLAKTRRYRPGYGDFDLSAQGELCAIVEAHRIGVRVNEAFMLLPRKSVTGVVGFRPRSEEKGEGDEPGRSDSEAEPSSS